MKVAKIQFKKVGKKYYFSPGEFQLKDKDKVVVETARGIEMGSVVGEVLDIEEENLVAELKPVIRLATAKDIVDHDNNKKQEEHILSRTKFFSKKNNLQMKVLGCEYTLDRGKLIIYFEAEGRIDFRQLVKDLAEEFRVRIELRQVGSRDGAKFIGGLGPCGLVMCCVTHIGEFDNVSIKMAKNQNLSLNPQKISGTCGKLLCCIKFENDDYQEARENLPDIGDFITTAEFGGKVIGLDILQRTVRIMCQDDKVVSLNAADIKTIKRKKKRDDDADLKGLE